MKIERPKSAQPLPDDARLVFKGVIFDTYQWRQKMFDGTVETFEKLKRPDTVTIFPILEDGKILLTKQKQPGKDSFIGAAGGRVDAGEDIISAAKRELLEETGYSADKFILWKAIQPISKIEWAVYVFIAKGLKKVSDLSLDAGEQIEAMPVEFEEFMQIALGDNFYEPEIYREIIEATFNEKKKQELKKLFSID
ncbi:MAG: hypothetical protein A2406_03895 [Candidatus Komeilibacteria bacterium RIFOXYC1_FULL_37_11]|uniref:Nudix hydrolase domain-containing protein n=1 Tax=Candidatus Komeilibacteria bacterium RIFOXYC1_FULL_37_11 TaxID=1798555 RepID=A0A1G2BX16_9BACT|nr:MAG: hypothetical protein A2406_03895 [Candidatus Komeilibacteria bacterium RIFOXYC1_FULL_37_11]OGY95874.1 MAG: hypothetical protein A2611_03825 [Candidatus Komeilibacteria bacterium RIFOXYD1_FULL_37_29]